MSVPNRPEIRTVPPPMPIHPPMHQWQGSRNLTSPPGKPALTRGSGTRRLIRTAANEANAINKYTGLTENGGSRRRRHRKHKTHKKRRHVKHKKTRRS